MFQMYLFCDFMTRGQCLWAGEAIRRAGSVVGRGQVENVVEVGDAGTQ